MVIPNFSKKTGGGIPNREAPIYGKVCASRKDLPGMTHSVDKDNGQEMSVQHTTRGMKRYSMVVKVYTETQWGITSMAHD